MLKSLEVWNFRQHRHKVFEFTEGLNVIRGANESGKSTIIEAITYALFGVSACREPLAAIVTWGEAVTSLKVRLVMEVQGIEYVITRKKSGAEVNYGEHKVVGQTEVGEFIGRLFGCSTKNVNRLVLAGQGNIRGALEEGSAKTSALIEELANFQVIDQILSLIGQHLVTGPTARLEERALQLAAELEPLEAALGAAPDTDADEARLAELQAAIAAREPRLQALLEALDPVAASRDALRERAAERARLEERVTVLYEAFARASEQAEACEAAQPDPVDMVRLEELRGLIAAHEETQRRLKGREALAAIRYPATFWDKPLDDFRAAGKETENEWRRWSASLEEHKASIRIKEAERTTAGQCGYCGQDFSQLPEVRAKNEAITQEIVQLTMLRDAAACGVRSCYEKLQKMDAIAKAHDEILRALAPYGRDIRWDTSVVPHKPTWANNAMAGVVSVDEARAELAKLDAGVRAIAQWQGQQQSCTAEVNRAWQEWSAVRDRLDKGFEDLAALPALEAKCEAINAEYSEVYSGIVEVQNEAAEIQARVTTAKQAYELAKSRVEMVRAMKAEAEKSIVEMMKNNALQKRVREARPVIANKLWNKVLASVSQKFSQMRQMESVVTKDADGFKVNGKPIEGLSGSTLDVLGLAIRVALIRAFLPHTPLSILDEPSAACDDERTKAMMGFLVACGFDQLLLVTHESMSEAVAENLIAL